LTHFIKINFREHVREHVNLAYVERIVARSDGEGWSVITFYGRGNEVIGTSRQPRGWGDVLMPTVPAAAGAVATVVYVSDSENARPTKDDLFVERAPIVAWRLTGVFAFPILPEEPTSNGTILIEMPDGRLKEPAMRLYDDLDKAKDDILRTAQSDWDREHNDKITCKGPQMKPQSPTLTPTT
jgi:hypothetical protein